MPLEVASSLYTSSHDAVSTILDSLHARGARVTCVISLADPGAQVPPVTDWAAEHNATIRHTVIRCVDADMPDGMWVSRFGGTADELFQPVDASTLIAEGRLLGERAARDEYTVIHCAAGVSRSTAATASVLAAAGFDPHAAIRWAAHAQTATFMWRHRVAFLPNKRILETVSESLYGDTRLLAAYQTPA